MKILFATFDGPEGFLSRLDMEGAGSGHAGRLKVATKARYKAREPVVLEIGFPGLPNRVLLRATFAEEASQSEAIFELVPGEDHKRDFLVAVASGRAQAKSLARKHRRFPMRLPARFVVEGQDVPLRGDAETEDVGPNGVFLKTPRSLPEGARVTVVLDPLDGSAELELSGRVVYTRLGKESGGDQGPGIGVQFDKPTTDDRKRLRRLIRDVKVQGRLVAWEDEAAKRAPKGDKADKADKGRSGKGEVRK
jgi:Tfp pilus assembly protein PilZ